MITCVTVAAAKRKRVSAQAQYAERKGDSEQPE